MLCPKCGYITFDKLDACPKCRKDLSGIADKIGGTASAIGSVSFLDKVLGKGSQDDEIIEQDSVSVEESSSQPVEAVDVLGSEGSDVSFDELPEIVLSDIAVDEAKPEIKEELELSIDESAKISEGELELSIDGKDSLEIEMPELPVQPPPPPKAEDKGAGQTGLDLNDIDLSDLVTEEKEPEAPLGVSEDLDLDLSSLEIESPKSEPVAFVSDLQDDDDFDLSLDLDLGEELSEKKKSDAVIPDLGLSLEKDE